MHCIRNNFKKKKSGNRLICIIAFYAIIGTYFSTTLAQVHRFADVCTSPAQAESYLGHANSEDIVDIPDTVFLNSLIYRGVDINGDSLISYNEAEAITYLVVPVYEFCLPGADCWPNMYDMTGIEAFTNLDTLFCNGKLTSLDVSNCINLSMLDCSGNYLTSLDVSGCQKLKHLNCGRKYFGGFSRENILTSLNISNNTVLTYLEVTANNLSSLDISNNSALETMLCNENQLSSLDVSNNTALTSMEVSYNNLTSLDISNDTTLESLFCSSNPLTSLNISSNKQLKKLSIHSMPDLHEICVWTNPFYLSGVDVTDYGSPYVCFQTDCNGDCSISGVVKESCQQKVAIYPNPINTLLIIETDMPGLYHIHITSLNGRLLVSEKMEGTTHQIDLSSFRKGVYFITIKSKDFVTTRKIIKY